MAASDQQVALARGHRATSTQLNRAGRQVVPAFLQKLYEMVNDSANDDLIRWSDTGDSFFVMDHERFAREVLGRWFKHQNFSSFVRQLNMYGFHKIPHLQQGVLRSETDTEFWNFEHPHFHRGQPDMLCFIQRKKQAAQPGDDSIDIREAPHLATASSAANLSPGQILDVNSIVNGLAAIKRHQTTISSDLNELKSSNQLLWQEALTAREKHKKHQDTINRILKFLAGVFGNNGGSVHKEDAVDHAPSRAVVPRMPQRLMIDVGPNRKGKVGIVEEEDQDMHSHITGRDVSPATESQLSSNETLPSSVVSPSITPSETFSLPDISTPFASRPIYLPGSTGFSTSGPTSTSNLSKPPLPDPLQHPSPNTSLPKPTPNTSLPKPTPPHPYPSDNPQASELTTPPAPAPNNTNPDAMMQAAFADMLHQPNQMQRLLAALASQPSYSLPDPVVPGIDPQATSPSQLQSYEAPYDFYRGFSGEPASSFNPVALLESPPHAEADAVSQHQSLAGDAARLDKTYEDSEGIDKDVNALQSSLTSLIESLGLDLSAINTDQPPGAVAPIDAPAANASDAPSLSGVDEPAADSSGIDFDFDALFNEFSGNGDDNNYIDHLDSTAFLDEVPSPSDGRGSPVTTRNGSPTNFTKTSRKRKSDIADIDQQHTKSSNYTTAGTKSKRKR